MGRKSAEHVGRWDRGRQPNKATVSSSRRGAQAQFWNLALFPKADLFWGWGEPWKESKPKQPNVKTDRQRKRAVLGLGRKPEFSELFWPKRSKKKPKKIPH